MLCPACFQDVRTLAPPLAVTTALGPAEVAVCLRCFGIYLNVLREGTMRAATARPVPSPADGAISRPVRVVDDARPDAD